MNFDDRMHAYESVDAMRVADAVPVARPRSVSEALARAAMEFVERTSTSITWLILRYPLQTRLVIGSLFLITLLVGAAHNAHAALTAVPVPTGQSLLQNEIDVAYSLESDWGIFDKALTLAATLFATLAILSVIVASVNYYINNQSVKGLGQLILSRVLSLGIPYLIITTAKAVFPLVALIGLHIADQVTGQGNGALAAMPLTGVPQPGDVQTALTDVIYNTWTGYNGYNSIQITPRNIVTEGVTIAWPLVQIWQKLSVQTNPDPTTGNGPYFEQQQMVMGFVLTIAIGIIAMFTFIAVELILAYLQIYLVLPVAAFSLGFLGSPATKHYGAGYWNVVAQSMLRFIAVVFVIGFACVLAEKWDGDFATSENAILNGPYNAQQNAELLKLAISAFIVTGSLFVIVRALPGMFAAVLFGGPGAGAEGIANSEGQIGAIGQRASPGGGLAQQPGRMNLPRGTQGGAAGGRTWR